LYEVENGIYNINYRPRNPIPVEDFLKSQSRFAHVLKRPELIEEIKEFMRKIWDFLEFMSTRKESEDKKENV